MNRTLNSISDRLRDASYSIKSLGKSHQVKTLSQLNSMSVRDIHALDPSDVSKSLLEKVKKNKHRTTLGSDKSAALDQLAIDKRIFTKKSDRSHSGRREAELSRRKSRSARNAANEKAVERLLAMAEDELVMEKYEKMPSVVRRRKGGKQTKRRRKIKN
jgi:hypothetical protein